MREVLFSKYSGERNPQFAIRTSIIQDGEEKWVEKVPLTEEATAHIKRLETSYEKLREIYKGTKLRPCPVKIENGVAKFPFIDGVSFHEKLGNLIAGHNDEGIIALCKEYVSLIMGRTDIVPFQKTPEFIEVFGEFPLPEGLTGADFSNADFIFENVIEDREKM